MIAPVFLYVKEAAMAKGLINIAVKEAAKLKKEIEKNEEKSKRALQRTVSDFRSRAPGWVSTSVTEVYGIKKSDVKRCFKGAKKAAGKIRISGIMVDNIQLTYSGRLLTPTHFKMKPATVPAKRSKDKRLIPGQAIKSDKRVGTVAAVSPVAPYKISAEVYKGKRKEFKSANIFLGSNKGGGFIPFQRTGPGRNDIKSIKTVSVPQMITNETVAKNINEKINDGLSKRLEHHIEQEFKK